MIDADADRMGAQGWVGPYTEWAIRGTVEAGLSYVVIADEHLALNQYLVHLEPGVNTDGVMIHKKNGGCAARYLGAIVDVDGRCLNEVRSARLAMSFVCLLPADHFEHKRLCGWLHAATAEEVVL